MQYSSPRFNTPPVNIMTDRRISMTEKKETKTPKRRTQVKELPKNEKELSKAEQKKVKGGGGLMGLLNGTYKPQ